MGAGVRSDVRSWMQSKRLQLSTSKAEALGCVQQIPNNSLMIGLDTVQHDKPVSDHGIHLDSNTSMRTHVTPIVSSCFAVLRHYSSHQSIGLPVTHWCMLSRVDFGGATLACLPARLLERLQSVLSTKADYGVRLCVTNAV